MVLTPGMWKERGQMGLNLSAVASPEIRCQKCVGRSASIMFCSFWMKRPRAHLPFSPALSRTALNDCDAVRGQTGNYDTAEPSNVSCDSHELATQKKEPSWRLETLEPTSIFCWTPSVCSYLCPANWHVERTQEKETKHLDKNWEFYNIAAVFL